jgi:hypothetical protein
MSSAGHYADFSSTDLGMHTVKPVVPATETAPTWELFTETQKIELLVPENPRAVDFLRAYYSKIRAQADEAERAVLNAELDAANAERIAQAARAKAARLRGQVQDLEAELSKLA